LFAVQDALGQEPLWDYLTPTFTFLSVAEAALYSLSAKLAESVLARGGEIGDAVYREELSHRMAAEEGSPHMQRRLYPELPPDLPYVSFYPMSKRRHAPHNWYTLALVERDRLMREHGVTGRRFAGRIRQIVTGSIGFEEWEWGVTLFARDPLDLKHIVTEMRYDPASAEFAEFGPFFVGRVCAPSEWLATLATFAR
jgi:chlorite dismutase